MEQNKINKIRGANILFSGFLCGITDKNPLHSILDINETTPLDVWANDSSHAKEKIITWLKNAAGDHRDEIWESGMTLLVKRFGTDITDREYDLTYLIKENSHGT